MVADSGSAGIPIDQLPQRLGVRPAAVPDAIAALKSELTKVGPRIWSSSVPDEVAKTIKKLVAEHHRTKPLEKGAPVNDLRTAAHVPSDLFDSVLQDITAAGKLKSDGGLIRQPNFSAELAGADDALATAILAELTAAGPEPPTVAEMTPRYGPKIGNVMRFLERGKRVVQVEPGRFYTIEALQAVLDRLKGIMSKPREYTPAELREGLGTSRKFLIPLLEYCDRQGLTTRTETGRTWRGSSKGPGAGLPS
jgi:selenocysteine-specific elongation factor